MALLGLFRLVLQVISGGFMLVGLFGTVGGLCLLASPHAVVTFNGITTKAIGPKAVLACGFFGFGVVGVILWVYGPRVALGFIQRAIERREE